MADQLFKKRRAKKAQALRRKKAKRSAYDRVLIVCEGEKTEPNYLKALINDLKLNTANVVIAGNTCGSSPISIVNFALREYKKDNEYDRLYCVFDKDCHTTYSQALDKIRRSRLAGRFSFTAITSVPCFEFWLLLHFFYTTKPFDTGTGSICAKVITDLKKYIPDYEKGNSAIYRLTKDKLNTAVIHSKQVAKHCKTSGTDMPSTNMHILVEYLQNLKS